MGLAPFAVMEHRAMGIKLKKLSMIGNGTSVAELYDLGVMCRDRREDVLGAIIEAMEGIDWNVLHLNELREDPVNRALYEKISERWETDDVVHIPCPRTDLPLEGDVLDVASSRTRRTIRKTIEHLEMDNRIDYRTVDLPEEAAEAAWIRASSTGNGGTEGGASFANENLSPSLQGSHGGNGGGVRSGL